MDLLPNGFDELCEEKQILVFFERLLEGWRQEVGGMTEPEKQTARGETTVATFNQCERNLGPLFELCRKKVLPDDIREAFRCLQSIRKLMTFCERHYPALP